MRRGGAEHNRLMVRMGFKITPIYAAFVFESTG